MSEQFIGVWKLVSVEYHRDDQIFYPKDTFRGYIIYTPNGYMSVHIMATERQSFKSDDWLNGTSEEYTAAGKTYTGYCGRYEVRENTVIHHVELSHFPNWVGIDFVRYFDFRGDTLVLKTPPMLIEGYTQIGQLVWQKVK
ncbi:MAG: lipocalin-like domain-containing protein [Candidatus Hodarchaeales archaeon]|jgi:hypothetical protein